MLQRIKITTLIQILLISSRLSVVMGFGALFLCNHIPSLSPKQRALCESYPDVMGVIGEGTRLGIGECEHQFRFSRWNCTPSPQAQFNHAHVVVTGSREAAFLYAITSSGVTYAITQACGRGNISSCGCAPPTTIATPPHSSPLVRRSGGTDGGTSALATWRWGGCSADIDFALGITRKFIDAREVEGDARSLMNLHNNKAGRKMVESTLETECKCHGVSGSCTLKTCWLKLPSFREVGDRLLLKYQEARPVVAVQETQQGPRFRRSLMLLLRPKPKRSSFRRAHPSRALASSEPRLDSQPRLRHLGRKGRERKRSLKDTQGQGSQSKAKPRRTELVYLDQSPNYCEEDRRVGSLGTKGRRCLKGGFPSNRSMGNAQESCDILCCGRGYNTHHILSKWKCGCKFRWCCEVQCQNCQEQMEILTCN